MRDRDKETYRKILKSDDRRGEVHKTVKLDCCGTVVEITKPGDQLILCPNPKCRKRSIVTWGLTPKISTEPSRQGDVLLPGGL